MSLEQIAISVVRLTIELIFNLGLMAIWIKLGAFEFSDLPRPTWRQAFAITLIITCLSH
jgi:hypothetical protein